MIIIQARTDSKRLPGKVLLDIEGKTMLQHVFDACRKAVNNVVVAIPYNDLKLIDYCKVFHIPCFEGHETDLINRYWHCAKTYNAEHIVRITADCPLVEPYKIQSMFEDAIENELDFATNLPTYDGTDIEIMSWRCLDWAYWKAPESMREHVTTFIKSKPDKLRTMGFLTRIHKDKLPYWLLPKLSVDTQDDLDRVREIVRRMNDATRESR